MPEVTGESLSQKIACLDDGELVAPAIRQHKAQRPRTVGNIDVVDDVACDGYIETSFALTLRASPSAYGRLIGERTRTAIDWLR